MALYRTSVATTLAAVLLGGLLVGSASAQYRGPSSDVVPGIGATIPSPRAKEIAPLHRLYQTRHVAEAPQSDAPRRTATAAAPTTARAPADVVEGASGPVADHDRLDAAKAAVPASQASAGGPDAGEGKSDERLDPASTPPSTSLPTAVPTEAPAVQQTTPSSEDTSADIPMVRVPAPIVTAARKALPGIAFTAVDLSRSGSSTVYGLSGKSDSGREVSVSIDQSGKILTLDRQARDAEIPDEVMTLAEAVLPGARIDRAALSLRPAFRAFYTFTGTSASGQPFVLEIRSDGRALAFVDPE